MERFLILHYGFEEPSAEEMTAWNEWFDSIADRQIDRGGLRGGRELSDERARDLPFVEDSLTGYTIIEAESLDAAEAIARECPIVSSTQIYPIQK